MKSFLNKKPKEELFKYYSIEEKHLDYPSISNTHFEYYSLQLKSLDYYSILPNTSTNRLTIKDDNKCDKYDYLAAVACGAIGGLIDIMFVGSPLNSKLGKWTDDQVDNVVKAFASKLGWNPRSSQSNNVKSAIGFLENKFKVNYDQRKSSDVNNLFKIAPNTHHMMSLGHSPDIIGLFFSILNQFTDTSTFIADGKLITIDTTNQLLYGSSTISKILCGCVNWFGHLMSDVAGSSGSHNRGTGINMPFYELFGFCKFGKFNTRNGLKDLAELTQAAYNQGYDARFGMTMAIPVVITDMLIRIIWSLRRYFQYRNSVRQCIPNANNHEDLRVMILMGQGTLCMFDVVDATVRSGGDPLAFFMHLNLVAWFRFAKLVFKEICIRFKITLKEQEQTSIYKKINHEIKDKQFIYAVDNARNKNDMEGLVASLV